MAKVFITGVAGFLGSHLADAMLALGHEVIGVDNMIGGDVDNVPGAVDFVQADCNETAVMRDYMAGCDLVYHCAATAYEGLSVFSPHLVTQNIVTASTGVFSAAVATGVKRIVHCSSMARYGAGRPPFCEFYTPRPQDPYGIGKLAAEGLLRNICETHGVEFVIAVPHNIIGPRQKYDDPFRNVASIMINLMLQGRPPIIYGDGQQRRCFSFIDDCLSCLVKMGFQDGLSGEVINIGPDEGTVSIATLARIIAEIVGYTGPFTYMPGRPQEVRVAICSSAKARKLLDYQTTVRLKEGLTAMVDYIVRKGPKPFMYHLPLEFTTEKTPKTWSERLF